MPLKAIYKKDFIIENDSIILSNDYLAKNAKKFKKITGSRLASVLDLNKYTSPLKMWMIMTNIYYEEMDETLSKTGNIVEPILRKYAEEKSNVKFKVHNVFEVKWDVFKDDEIFGGVPDGEPVDDNNNFLYSKDYPMLEIKTTSIDSLVYKKENEVLRMQKDENNIPLVKTPKGKLADWYDSNNNLVIPMEYKLQLSLYMYLRKITHGLFVVGFLEKEDYAYPEKFDPSKRKIEFATLELNNDEFQGVIDVARHWYNKYITTGISPKITDEDRRWLKTLISD